MVHCGSCGGVVGPSDIYCRDCGAPLTAVPRHQALAPEDALSPPPSLGHRPGRGNLVALAAIIALAIVVPASFLWLASQTGATPPPPSQPNPVVAFAPAQSVGSGTWKIEVGSVSQAVNLSNYQVSIRLNGTWVSGLQNRMVMVGTVGAAGGLSLTFADVNGDGRLTGGDFFTLSGTRTGLSYQLELIWGSSGPRIAAALIPP